MTSSRTSRAPLEKRLWAMPAGVLAVTPRRTRRSFWRELGDARVLAVTQRRTRCSPLGRRLGRDSGISGIRKNTDRANFSCDSMKSELILRDALRRQSQADQSVA